MPRLSEGLKSGSPDGGVWSVDGESALRAGGVNSRDTWLLIKDGSSGRCAKQIAKKWMRREGKEEKRRGRGQKRGAPNLKRGSENIYLFTIVWLHLWHFCTTLIRSASRAEWHELYLSFCLCLPPATHPVSTGTSRLHNSTQKVDNDVRSCFFGEWGREMWLQTITHVHWDLKSTHELDFLL